jgi:hypothetical protein
LSPSFAFDNDLHPSHVYAFNARFTEGDKKATVDALNNTQFKVAAISGLTKSLALKYGLESA